MRPIAAGAGTSQTSRTILIGWTSYRKARGPHRWLLAWLLRWLLAGLRGRLFAGLLGSFLARLPAGLEGGLFAWFL